MIHLNLLLVQIKGTSLLGQLKDNPKLICNNNHNPKIY